MPTPLTLDPELPNQPPFVVVLTAVLVAVQPYPNAIVVVLPPPPIDTGLLDCVSPIPTPLTLDPEKAMEPEFLLVLTAVLTTLLPYPTIIVIVLPPPPIDPGLLVSSWPMPTPLTLDPVYA